LALTPASEYVVIVSVSVALSVTFAGCDVASKVAPESIEAVVVSLTMLIATPAPMPTVPASSSFAFAFAVLSTTDAAERMRSDPFSLSPGGPRAELVESSALVVMSAIVRARAPEMPTLPAPAPEVASVSKEFLPFAPVPLFMSALSARPFVLKMSLTPAIAWFLIVMSLIETAAAMLAVAPFTALAFVLTVESASSVVFRLAAAVGATIVTPLAIFEIA
jgi:hypothetical protein